MRLSAKFDTAKLEANLDRVGNALLKAGTRAVNKLADQAQVAGLRQVAAIYGVGPRAFEKYVETTFANDGEFEARITVKGAGLPLSAFNPRQTKGGVTVQVKKGRRFLVPHAFIARMSSGHMGVFARGAYGGKGVRIKQGGRFGRFEFGYSKRRKKDRGQLAINELYTFAPPDAFSNPEVTKAMDDRVLDQIDKVVRQEVNFALRSVR